jgi:hypothetical protein
MKGSEIMAYATFVAMHNALILNRLNHGLDFICETPIQNPTWLWWQQTRFNDINIASNGHCMGFFANDGDPVIVVG